MDAARCWLAGLSLRRSHAPAALLLGGAVLVVAAVYLALSLDVSRDPVLLPLDDTYIHFQYARQIAHGEPLVYNPGDPATSGGTSLIYPWLLAAGYALGFDGWALSTWALMLGIGCWLGAVWLVYLLGTSNPFDHADGHEFPQRLHALGMALAFAVGGPFIWAALSGMETALFTLLVLLTVYAVRRTSPYLLVLAGVLCTLTRPEGVIVSGLAVVAWALRRPWPGNWRARAARGLLLALPVLAAGIQPLVNWAATGDVSSSGLAAKSRLANSSIPLVDRVADVLAFWGRMWRELLSGSSPDFGAFTSPLLAPLALAVLLAGSWRSLRQRRVTLPVLLLASVVVLTAAIATLDTAFWQFKRYQVPVMALFFPAAAWGSRALGRVVIRRGLPGLVQWGMLLLIVLPALLTTVSFARHYRENVRLVRDQQVAMARWVRDNLPESARVGAHDVGLLRYFGDRDLYDVVGLTTPGAAEAWRQGPGAIYETMAASDTRPGYFAIYPDIHGLGYLRAAGVFGDVLAEFAVTLPARTVASADDYQAVYRADWSTTHAEDRPAQLATLAYLAQGEDAALVDTLDVAHLASEAAHDYDWWQDGHLPGFASEVYTLNYAACEATTAVCRVTDGGRVLSGGEAFTLHTQPGIDLLLVTRVHGRAGALLDVSVDGELVATRVQPHIPGQWIEIVTFVSGARITGERTRVRMELSGAADPAVDAYMPYSHWAYQGDFSSLAVPADVEPLAVFGAAERVRLIDYTLTQTEAAIMVDLTWLGPAPGAGDGIVFVHLYNQANLDSEPVAQAVRRAGAGTLPPGNWLPGLLHDRYIVPLPDDLEMGQYVVILGLFDARTGARYPVQANATLADGRLILDDIRIEE